MRGYTTPRSYEADRASHDNPKCFDWCVYKWGNYEYTGDYNELPDLRNYIDQSGDVDIHPSAFALISKRAYLEVVMRASYTARMKGIGNLLLITTFIILALVAIAQVFESVSG